VVRGQSTLARVDPSRAQQIFANLVDNALKHGGARGEIAIDLTTEEGEAVVTVADEGEGIPPAEIDRIFHRFYRVDKSRSSEGTGLGLAIVKHLVLLHGGSIRAYNREGGGAAFEVRLPAAPF
jgi:signal transduction histidine kinase